MNSSNRTQTVCALAGVLLLAGAVITPVRAQELRLELSPVVDSISGCSEGELAVSVRLVNPNEEAIAGYQVFLRFPADTFSFGRFDALALDSFLSVNGPGELGGFEPCASETADPWDDGSGEDVVAIVGSVFGEGSQEPLTDASVELGRLVFHPVGLVTEPGGASFRLNDTACHFPVEQVARLFGPSGAAVPATFSGEFSVSVTAGGPQLEDLTCIDRGASVELLWVYPEGAQSGVNIYRAGELFRTIPIPAIVSIEDDDPLPGETLYEVAIRQEGGEGCRLSCTIDRTEPEFLRGDANRDGSVNVTDAVAVLDHLFAGIPITCLDAGDVDDDGNVNLTDAVVVLEHLFGGSGPLALPFPDAGVDPTDDSIGCEL